MHPNVLFRQEALGLTDGELATAVRSVARHLHCPEDRVLILPIGETFYDTLVRGMALSGAKLVERDGILVLDLDGPVADARPTDVLAAPGPFGGIPDEEY